VSFNISNTILVFPVESVDEESIVLMDAGPRGHARTKSERLADAEHEAEAVMEQMNIDAPETTPGPVPVRKNRVK
jgi:hypothetical protein